MRCCRHGAKTCRASLGLLAADERSSPVLRQSLSGLGLELRPVFPPSQRRKDPGSFRALGLDRWFRVEALLGEVGEGQIRAKLRTFPGLARLETDGRGWGAGRPDDSLLARQWSGTSQAAPHVTGLAALMLSLAPTLGPEELRSRIAAGAEDHVGDPLEDGPGWDPYYGEGRVNATRTLYTLATDLEHRSGIHICSAAISSTAPRIHPSSSFAVRRYGFSRSAGRIHGSQRAYCRSRRCGTHGFMLTCSVL